MAVTPLRPDPIASGFYTLRDAARLLGIDNLNRIRGWLDGHPHRKSGPILQRQFEPMNGVHEISFLDLMEIRFIDHFRKQKISLQSLRKAAKNAREVMKQPHPFATSDTKFMTDRRKVFLHTAKENGDHILLDLMTNQMGMYEAYEQVLAKGVSFDPRTGIALRWQPAQNYPSVVIDPRLAYGQPVIGSKGVPTRAIVGLWKAEGGCEAASKAAAKWFHITTGEVGEAVQFEASLAA